MERADRVAHYKEQSRLADRMTEQGNTREALRLLESVRDRAGAAGDEDYRALFASEQIGYSSDDWARAARELAEALARRQQAGIKPDPFLLHCLGAEYGLAGDHDAAIGWFDRALAVDPEDWEAMRGKGVVFSKRGDVNTALLWYERALAANPKDPTAMRCKGWALAEKEDLEGALLWFDNAIALEPRYSAAMRDRGITLAVHGDQDGAIEWYEKALAISPNDWHAIRQKGVALSEKGEFDAALECYDEALKVSPRDGKAMLNKGATISAKGDEDVAIEWYDKAMEVNPKDDNAMWLKGMSLSIKGDLDGAISWYEKALAENPRNWQAMRQKGVTLAKMGRYADAITWHDRALEINPKDWEAMRNKGAAFSKIGDQDAAIVWYDKALEANPKDYDAMREKGFSLAKKGNREEAIVCFDMVLTANPKDSLSHHQAAIAELRLGRAERAFGRMREAVRLEPKRWQGDFRALCNIIRKDPEKEWSALFPSQPTLQAGAASTVSLPEAVPGAIIGDSPASVRREGAGSGPPEGERSGMGLYIEWLRESLTDERPIYEAAISKGKAIRTDFLRGPSILVEGRSMFLVPRRWNSYSPAIPSIREERSVGGGYFLWHNGGGTVIDPGLNFIENFALAGCRLGDIRNIILTHAHNDHTADFESLRTLLHQRNREVEEYNKTVKRREDRLQLSRVRFFLANSAFQKFGGMLSLASKGFTHGVFTLNADSEFDLGEGAGRLRVLPAYHDDILSRNHAVGLLFVLNTPCGKRRLLLTSDTGLYPLDPDAPVPIPAADSNESEIYHRYNEAGGEQCDVMVLHIGSVKKEELDPATETHPRKACYPNHMGIIGVTRTILACRPKLALISEFGEEMKGIRVRLMEHIQRDVIDVALTAISPAERPRVLPADPGLVYDIGAAEFVDWADVAWKPITCVGFGQPQGENPTGAVGYFQCTTDEVSTTARARNAIANFGRCLSGRGGHLRCP